MSEPGLSFPAPHLETVPEIITVTIEWRGVTFSIPKSIDDCDMEVLEAFEEGKATKLIRALLGEETYAEIKRTVKPKVKDLQSLTESIAERYGFGKSE